MARTARIAGAFVALAILGAGPAMAGSPPAGFNCPVPAPATVASAAPVAITDQPTPANPGDPPVGTNVVESPIAVANVGGVVLDIDVTTNITHASSGDLQISLVSPTGKEIELSQNNGGSASDVFNGTLWDDQADPGGPTDAVTPNQLLATDHTYVSGEVATKLVPDEALAAYIGDLPNGTWKLRVWDGIPGGVGSIQSWSLAITTSSQVFEATMNGSSSALVVPDGGTVSGTIRPTATNGTANARVAQVTVQLSGFTYTGMDDLALTLRSPQGTLVTLTRRNALADRTATVLTWQLPNGPYVGFSLITPVVLLPPGDTSSLVAPEESFGAFLGQDPTGDWTFTATDAGATVGAGSIGQVRLSVGTWAPCTPPVITESPGDIQLAVTGPPSGTKVGREVTYTATVTSTGAGPARAVSIILTPFTLVGTRVTPSPGGTCMMVAGQQVGSCSWKDPTPPGATRSVTITGTVATVGKFGIGANVSATTTNLPPAPNPLVGRYANYGPFPSVIDPTIKASNGAVCTVVGSNGNDRIEFLPGVVCGRGGDDVITTATGRDTIDGGLGNDTIDSGPGNDKVFGGKGNDTIKGNKGDDLLDGGAGNDAIDGGRGNDRLIGGLGKDKVTGGAGTDAAKRDGKDKFVGVERFFVK